MPSALTPAKFDQALRAVCDTAFVVGEWDRNESGDTFEAVYERAERAKRRLWRLVGLTPPKRCVKCGRIIRKVCLAPDQPERCARCGDS